MAARRGRPPSCTCGECRKCKNRIATKAAYDKLTPAERRAIVERRDAEKVRASDKARYLRDKPKRIKAAQDYAARHHEQVNGDKKRWQERNPEKRRAHIAVSNAIRDGKLVKGPCEFEASGECEGRIEAHHDDYSRLLEVRWFCSRHHGETRRAA